MHDSFQDVKEFDQLLLILGVGGQLSRVLIHYFIDDDV